MEAVRPELLTEAELPVTLGRYTLESILGEGGMARVFRATLSGPSGFEKAVALKVVREKALDDTGRAQLISEARIGGLLNHPHVVNTYDLGEIDDTLVIAMELVPGPSVLGLMRRVGVLPARAALEVAVQSCRGLEHAHELTAGGRPLNLVHRDLKPGNLLVTPDGTVKVADFGIALAHGIADGREVMGTPSYMSPEQIRGVTLGPRSDLFAMGAVLCHLVLGASPFRRHSAAAAVRAIQDAGRTLARARTIEELEARALGLGRVVAKCLELDPGDRWATARELVDALERVAARLPPGPSLVDLVAPSQSSVPEAVASPADTSSAGTTIQLLDATNVVPATDRFVGRQSELRAISEHLEARRLVTVAGPGGTGKSRLVRQWVELHADGFSEGGAWLVDVGGVDSRGELVSAVATVLGHTIDGDGDEAVARVGEWLAERGPTLVVLDPLEGRVEHAAQPLVRWLERAPGLRVLAASRERLRLPGEAVLVLEPLPVKDAVELFMARVGERSVDLGGQQTLKAQVHALVDRMEGIPLALELAAAQLPDTRLSRLLRRRSDDALRSVLEASWEALTPAERHVLAQLSVFADGFTIEDAEAVLDLSGHLEAPYAVFVVEALVDKSLVRTVPIPELRGRHRFGLYDNIRRFAASRLRRPGAVETTAGAPCSGPDEVAAVQRRFVARFARRAHSVEMEGLDARRVERRWLRLSLDLGNLRAATTLARAAGLHRDAARIGLAATRVLERQGAVGAGLEVLEGLVDLPLEPDEATPLRLERARLLRARGRLSDAREALLRVRKTAPSASVRLDVETQLASLRLAEGDGREAARALEARLDTLRDDADARRCCRAELVLARCHASRSLPRALDWLGRARGRVAGVGSVVVEADVDLVEAELVHRSGESTRALEVAGRALSVARRLGDGWRVARVHGLIGTVQAELGVVDRARTSLRRAAQGLQRAGDRYGAARAQARLAGLELDAGDLDEARAGLEAALAVLDEGHRRLDAARVEVRLAELDALEGELLLTGERLDRTVETLAELGASAELAVALAARAAHRAEALEPDAAERDLATAMRHAERVGDPWVVAELGLQRCRVQLASGHAEAARATLESARRMLGRLRAGPRSRLGLLSEDLGSSSSRGDLLP